MRKNGGICKKFRENTGGPRAQENIPDRAGEEKNGSQGIVNLSAVRDES
jgi:hypothetical protein